MGPDGCGTVADAIQAIEYATSIGAKVICCSWGVDKYSRALEDAIEAADASGIIVVAAAGNTSSDNDLSPVYPASYPCSNIISVAASDRNGDLASFSCWGANSVDIAAPGDMILSTVPGNAYERKSGTSMAAPHVAGAAMLAWAHNPDSRYTDIISSIRRGAEPSPSLAGKVATSGRLNLLRMLEPDQPPEPDPNMHAVALTLNQGDFLHGDTLSLSASVGWGAQSPWPLCDSYLAVALPDGRLFFLKGGGGWSSAAEPFVSNFQVVDLEARIGSFAVPDNLPSGKYVWYAVLTAPRENPFRAASWTSNLGQAPFAVQPAQSP
jgi:subtilisin family serine protease